MKESNPKTVSYTDLKRSLIANQGYFHGSMSYQDFLEANTQTPKRDRLALAIGLILRPA